jgi:hypothetical protein
MAWGVLAALACAVTRAYREGLYLGSSWAIGGAFVGRQLR